MFSFSVAGLLASAGTAPLFQALAIILGTFILEDAATVLAAMRVEDGGVKAWVALGALYAGIVLGDLGLYGLGRLAATWPWARTMLPPERQQGSRSWVEKHVFRLVFISRFIPGARLPTYTSCGYLGANFASFALAAIFATSIWTSLLFYISLHVGRFLIAHFGAWRWSGAVVFAIVIVAMTWVVARVRGASE